MPSAGTQGARLPASRVAVRSRVAPHTPHMSPSWTPGGWWRHTAWRNCPGVAIESPQQCLLLPYCFIDKWVWNHVLIDGENWRVGKDKNTTYVSMICHSKARNHHHHHHHHHHEGVLAAKSLAATLGSTGARSVMRLDDRSACRGTTSPGKRCFPQKLLQQLSPRTSTWHAVQIARCHGKAWSFEPNQ